LDGGKNEYDIGGSGRNKESLLREAADQTIGRKRTCLAIANGVEKQPTDLSMNPKMRSVVLPMVFVLIIVAGSSSFANRKLTNLHLQAGLIIQMNLMMKSLR